MPARTKASRTHARPKVVGFVCEGSTDYVVLRAIAERVLGPIDARCLQPVVDALDRQARGGRGGWSEVRAWCEQQASLDGVFAPLVGDALDVLVIAIDLDIAVQAGLEKHPANLSAYDATALCATIKSWLPQPIDRRVIVAIPVMSTEAWVLASLYPKLKRPEAIAAPSEELVTRGKLQRASSGRPWKHVADYRPFATQLAGRLASGRARCGEADRFARKLERAAG